MTEDTNWHEFWGKGGDLPRRGAKVAKAVRDDAGRDIAEGSAIGLGFQRGEFRNERKRERACPANPASAGEGGWKP